MNKNGKIHSNAHACSMHAEDIKMRETESDTYDAKDIRDQYDESRVFRSLMQRYRRTI